ncbi:MAG TPA: ABC transporter ATP-binding protein [Anaerolineaceae bacterium]|nr:ABC transporter ATP-binding protein [Anaerolineaceae bacterium]
MANALLEVKNLSRRYDEYEAVKAVDFELRSGDLIALVGPNGSGKSTLLTCLSGMQRPTTGEVRVEGYDLYENEREVRRRLAYVPDVPQFYTELTAWEHITWMAAAHHVDGGVENRAETLLREFGLWDARDLFPHAYSRGMRLKLGIVLALIRPFSVLLLDEPSSALDPESTTLLGERLRELTRANVAVILTTHNLQFSEQLAARVWTMRDGCLSTQ